MPEPIYTAANCTAAYQLNWSLTVFWRTRPANAAWLDALQTATEADGIRILRHRFEGEHESLFFISTKPDLQPIQIPARVKGRLQHLLRDQLPKPFQRNYALRSVGDATSTALDQYVATQLDHHPMADQRVIEMLSRYQIFRPDVDLAIPRKTAHAIFWYNLHVVLVNEGRWREIREETVQGHHEMIGRASAAKGHLVRRAAIVADHLHLTLGCDLSESPEEVAVGYLNNLAFRGGMQPLFKFGYFVGTFGEYTRGAIVP